jgi:hypothetical protein
MGECFPGSGCEGRLTLDYTWPTGPPRCGMALAQRSMAPRRGTAGAVPYSAAVPRSWPRDGTIACQPCRAMLLGTTIQRATHASSKPHIMTSRRTGARATRRAIVVTQEAGDAHAIVTIREVEATAPPPLPCSLSSPHGELGDAPPPRDCACATHTASRCVATGTLSGGSA